MLTPIREARLRSDYEKVKRLAERSPLLLIRATRGDPPESYLLHYQCRTLVRLPDGQFGETGEHLVEVHLPPQYPRLEAPLVVHRAPEGVCHPNIKFEEPRIVCAGDFLPEQSLDLVCWRIFNILAGNNFTMDERHSLNHDAAAFYRGHQELFPTERRPLLGRPEEVKAV
jgi:hypothetical protein